MPSGRGVALFIDPPGWPARGRLWSHLASDSSYAELHAFARRLALPERGFHRDHYDVPAERYEECIAAGAESVSSRELLHRLVAAGLRRRPRSTMSRVGRRRAGSGLPMVTIPSHTRSVLLRAPADYTIDERPLERPGPEEVLVRVAAAGICGSDIELFEGTRPAAFVQYPIVPGHEWAGTVAAIGSAVRSVEVGDHVVAQGFRNCGTCARCRSGATNLCSSGYAETGFTHPGAFSGYVQVPARLLHRLRSDADLQAAALLEPSACVVEGLLSAPPLVGAKVAVIGTGTLSLVACQLLARQGAREVVVVSDNPTGREIATRWGATELVSVADAEAPDWICDADYVFESAGRANSARLAIAAARRGGTVVLEGVPAETADGDPTEIILKHLTVHGIFGASAAAWEQVVTLFNNRLLELNTLVSHRFGLDDVTSALETVRSRRPGVSKVLLMPDEPTGGS